jgi:hypothetical protein
MAHITNENIILSVPSAVAVTPLHWAHRCHIVLRNLTTAKYSFSVVIRITVIGADTNWLFKFRL